MERTVPQTGGEEIQLYMRTYYSLLRSSDAIQIETLVESHIAMHSSLHVDADTRKPDIGALLYSTLRLPHCIKDVKNVLIGQMQRSIIDAGYTDVAKWERVFAAGRRRRMHYNSDDILLMYIVSRSDIDDLIPILTAYQIEWNKLHDLLQNATLQEYIRDLHNQNQPLEDTHCDYIANLLQVEASDVRRLQIVWSDEFYATLLEIASMRKNIAVTLISGSLADYRRATANWWDELTQSVAEFGVDPESQPIYFVSSNTHSLVNLLTGFAQRHEDSLLDYITAHDESALLAEYEDIQQSSTNKSMENFLYYVLGKYISANKAQVSERIKEDERVSGIYRVPNKHGFEIEAQIIDIAKLRQQWCDPRLKINDGMAESNALILNIDYPLGMAAFEILSRINEHNSYVQGIYVMGKAATLNGRIGDVMIPNVVHDEHSHNTYLFQNCFTASHLAPYMTYGSVLDNQKAITALGTFLQNPGYMSVFYREGYTDIEMESGPYLSAIYEAYRPKRHPNNEIVNLYHVPFDVGFLHYASDAPMKKGQNLGAGSLKYTGVEPTYATAIAILNRIFKRETERLESMQAM